MAASKEDACRRAVVSFRVLEVERKVMRAMKPDGYTVERIIAITGLVEEEDMRL